MKANRNALLFVPMLLLFWGPAAQALSLDDLEEQLKSDYLDKILTLRHSYKGKHLSFRSDGSVSGKSDLGPWTVDGQIFVERIKLGDHHLQIRGRRICLVFNSKTNSYYDVLQWLAESDVDGRDKIERAFHEKEVEIEIALDSDQPDAQAISAAMGAVFLKPGESIEDLVPGFWRSYFDRIAGRPLSSEKSAEPVYTVKPGEVSPPHQTYSPDPSFSDDARLAKYQGTMVVSVVIDRAGQARDVRIVTPIGLGLDENAVAGKFLEVSACDEGRSPGLSAGDGGSVFQFVLNLVLDLSCEQFATFFR